jgi:hypothetical protein
MRSFIVFLREIGSPLVRVDRRARYRAYATDRRPRISMAVSTQVAGRAPLVVGTGPALLDRAMAAARSLVAALSLAALAACAGAPCETQALASRATIDCPSEWLAQAARPLDAALPGARTVKTLIDRSGGDAVYFTDTSAYPLHSTFAIDQLGFRPGRPSPRSTCRRSGASCSARSPTTRSPTCGPTSWRPTTPPRRR